MVASALCSAGVSPAVEAASRRLMDEPRNLL